MVKEDIIKEVLNICEIVGVNNATKNYFVKLLINDSSMIHLVINQIQSFYEYKLNEEIQELGILNSKNAAIYQKNISKRKEMTKKINSYYDLVETKFIK